MNEIDLTKLFVDYAQTKAHLVELEAIMKHEVLLRKKTVQVAGVTAKYYNPSDGTPDYEASVAAYIGDHPLFDRHYFDEFSETKVSFAWKDICKRFDITVIPGEPKPARVVLG